MFQTNEKKENFRNEIESFSKEIHDLKKNHKEI